MSSYTLQGKLLVIKDVQTFDSGFTKREFVVRTESQYPQDIQFELVKEKTSLIDGYNVGDPIEVHFDIRGREYQGRYFVNLSAWKLEGGAQPQPEAPAQQTESSIPNTDAPPPLAEDEDDLPF